MWCLERRKNWEGCVLVEKCQIIGRISNGLLKSLEFGICPVYNGELLKNFEQQNDFSRSLYFRAITQEYSIGWTGAE